MPTLTIEYRDDAERLALEQAIAYVAHLRQLAQDAPDGTVLAACERRRRAPRGKGGGCTGRCGLASG
jgi:hypothetical protein